MSRFSDKTTGIINTTDLKNAKVRFFYWTIFSIILFVSIISLFPPVWVLLSSMKDIKEFFAVPPTLVPKTFHIEKLAQVWNEMDFGKYYLNSLIMAAGDVAFCLIVNGLAGYVLSRLKPKGSKMLFAVIMWTMLMPTSLNLVPLFSTFLNFPILHINMTNTFLPMWIMSAANCFYILMFKNFFDTIPISYIESAQLDGCSNFRIFTRIVIPISTPIIMVVSIFTLTSSWDNFLWPYLILKNPNLYTVSVQLFSMKNFFSMDFQVVAILFAMMPPAILFVIFQKYIMDSGNMTGIKG